MDVAHQLLLLEELYPKLVSLVRNIYILSSLVVIRGAFLPFEIHTWICSRRQIPQVTGTPFSYAAGRASQQDGGKLACYAARLTFPVPCKRPACDK